MGLVEVARAAAGLRTLVAPLVLKLACTAWALSPHVDLCPLCTVATPRPDLIHLLVYEGGRSIVMSAGSVGGFASRLRPSVFRRLTRLGALSSPVVVSEAQRVARSSAWALSFVAFPECRQHS